MGSVKKGKKVYCGECCWFYAEDTYGSGCCPFEFGEVMQCDGECRHGEHYVSKEDVRHYRALLLQGARFISDRNRPTVRKMDDVVGFVEALKFADKYIKTFSDL